MTILPVQFLAIFRNEVRLNAKRIAPYFMFLLCAGNGLLWWGWGPAAKRWAINSDFMISGALPVYSFMTLPLFTALFMADPIVKDFRYGIDPLIFSKPISRAQYLLGKFFGNFFVLACCQSAFVLAWFVLQAVHKEGVIVVPGVRVVPYIKHFLVFVVISHLGLAAFYFLVGALTRSAKIVYGLGVSFYPIYITHQVAFLKSLPPRWRSILDPLVMNWNNVWSERRDPAFVNQMQIVYDFDLIANRVGMLVISALLLIILYYWFKTSESSTKAENFSLLNLSTNSAGQFYEMPGILTQELRQKTLNVVPIPKVSTANQGFANNVRKLIAALAVEFRLLLSERSLVVVMSLAVFLSILEVTFWPVRANPSFSAGYAGNTARSMLLFLIGIPIFYIGEAIHRDSDVRVEGMLWSHPIPNYVILSAKFISTLLLVFGLILSVGLIALILQTFKGNTPLELSAYLNVYSLILIPNTIFLCSFFLALHVLLRGRYLAYAVGIGICVSLFYLYSQGHTGSLYNPLLYNLWSYSDLAGPNRLRILMHRSYILALAAGFITIAHLVNARRTLRIQSRLPG